ncbi:MAG: leucine--tRNA ligase [Nanoarchaeota archaeon]|nr:leucine--tRNA ligase [Nanoarchaeota archaeon]MBU1321946.1 leucine--tRNA ligase [Nanoarchaeota archaeon]MBU1597942.1 leucine--tRNA ligase [Nanoarchaeota archaeon]MBU2441179.1 leucine--tRNA ligase [Nanoarchaeota archaeon]
MVDFNKISKKWQDCWEKEKIFEVEMDKSKPKFYTIEMFPYPSGSGLHMGHARNYVIGDVFARFKIMNGFNVLHPMGFDSFGLPAENAAIKAKSHPKIFVENAIKNFIKQQKALGLSYDWSRMITTHTPGFYKWDQWVFLQMYKKNLAFKRNASVNWCSKCNTVLANEQVHSGKCWRHEDTPVEIKNLNQWFFKTTAYAEELLRDIDKLKGWAEDVKIMQRNWIGKSQGTLIDFKVEGADKTFSVFTTRPDTLWGITYLVYAPEHPDVMELVKGTEYEAKVKKFIQKVVLEDKFHRTTEDKEKEGMFIGKYAIHPVTKEKIPIYIANFVLYDYGTGAIIAVPAHDQRDFEFAKKYKIPIKVVINPHDFELNPEKMSRAYMGDGNMVNSGEFNGDNNRDAIPEINKFLEKNKFGKATIQYKLKDWLISRQRFWGCPIPIIYCDKCPKEDVLMLHGWEDSSKKGFIPEFVKDLKVKGYNAFAFDQPNTDAPKFDEWYKFAEDKLKGINKNNLIIVGHSMGGLLALKLAEKYKLKKLVLVAPVGTKPSKKYFDDVCKELEQDELNVFKNYMDRDIDVEKIKKNAEKIVFIFGKKDPWINEEIRNSYISRFKDVADIHLLDYGHMAESEGFKKLELLENLFSKESIKAIPVPEKDLPVMLPENVKFGEKGGNPLETCKEFVEVKCPACGGKARRETDTMDTFVDSAWYFLRYCDPKNDKEMFDKKKVAYWMPVDMYIGGKEHATMHLIYFRFFTKFLRDIGLLKFDEPAPFLFNQGMLHKGGFVMSKSRGNVVTQEDIENKYGIDTARFFLMFVSSPDKDMEWDDQAVDGAYRFLVKVYRTLTEKKIVDKKIKNQESKAHKAILKVTEYISSFKYNLALISVMKLANYLYSKDEVSKDAAEKLLLLMAPFTPHLSEELWEKLGNKAFISNTKWPVGDKKKIDEKEEAAEDLFANVRRDILALQDLTGLTKPNKITLIVADEWKYKFISGLKKEMEKTRNPGDLIKSMCAKDKKNAKLIAGFVPRLVKNPDKLPDVVILQKEEEKAIKGFVDELEKEFKTKIDVVLEKDSQEKKAGNAMPAKPAIVFA